MNIDEKLIKASRFMDGELSGFEMDKIEKMIDEDHDMRDFIINAVKGNAYIEHSFKNQKNIDGVVMPDNSKKDRLKVFLRAASVILLVGIGILMSSVTPDKTGSDFAFADSMINPMYQAVINTALEKNRSGVAYKSRFPEMGTNITIVPEKTYRHNNSNYIRKFLITYSLGGKTMGAKGFAERKSKELWEIKTLIF